MQTLADTQDGIANVIAIVVGAEVRTWARVNMGALCIDKHTYLEPPEPTRRTKMVCFRLYARCRRSWSSWRVAISSWCVAASACRIWLTSSLVDVIWFSRRLKPFFIVFWMAIRAWELMAALLSWHCKVTTSPARWPGDHVTYKGDQGDQGDQGDGCTIQMRWTPVSHAGVVLEDTIMIMIMSNQSFTPAMSFCLDNDNDLARDLARDQICC